MSAHVNEFIPHSRKAPNGVQIDPHKLKFNNIRSCIAVVLCVYSNAKVGPSTITNLIGVHVNTTNMGNGEAELKTAVDRLKQLPNRDKFDVYLVGPYDAYYASTKLAKRLESLNPREIKLANLAVTASNEALQDIKFEAAGATLRIYQRDCVKIDYKVLKDKYDPNKGGTALTTAQSDAGKSKYVNDAGDKPWVLISNFEVLRFNWLGNMKERKPGVALP